MSNVFIALQANEESRAILDAILHDNPQAQVEHSPGLIKIDAPQHLVIKRSSVETQLGQAFDLEQLHLSLVSLAGEVDADDDQFILSWR